MFLGLNVVDIYDVSETEMSYTLRFYFEQNWLDPRLKVDPNQSIKTQVSFI